MKTVAITGASSGLGRALAVMFAKQGANLALFARNGANLNETARLCQTEGAQTLEITGDVKNEQDSRHFIESTIARFDGLDTLICNAGISQWQRVDQVSDPTVFLDLIYTNYMGAVYPTLFALPHLKTSNGQIVVISSLAGKMGSPLHAGYAASKHALHGFFDSLRLELGDSVKIMMVCPGWIKGTNLRQSAKKEASPDARTVHEVCQEIFDGLKRGKNEIFVPKKFAIIPWLRLLAPSVLNRTVLKKVSQQQ